MEIIEKYDKLYDVTSDIIHNIKPEVKDCITDISVGVHDTHVTLDDGCYSWGLTFPSRYYIMNVKDYISDWHIKEEARKKKEAEDIEKKKYEDEYKQYLELKKKFESEIQPTFFVKKDRLEDMECPNCGRKYLRIMEYGDRFSEEYFVVGCDACDFECPNGSADYGEAQVEFEDWIKENENKK